MRFQVSTEWWQSGRRSDSGRQTVPSPGAGSRERSVTERRPSGRSLARRTLTSWKIWGAVACSDSNCATCCNCSERYAWCQAVLALEHQDRVCTGFSLGYAASGGPSVLVWYVLIWVAVFWRSPPNGSVMSNARGYEKITIFDQFRALSWNWCKIEP